MNYYEHHLADYAQATAHLSMLEDAAYSRMLRWYYANEKPLPRDIKAIERLVRAQSKADREAVRTVLAEFFYEAEDGWHQDRADREIERYQDGEPEREIKKANEANRLKRHREERATLFRKLTEAGQHAPWNIGINELREMVKRLEGNAQEMPVPPLPATAPATPATATQTPDTRHQTPKEGLQPASTTLTAVGARASPGDLSGEMRKAGIQSNPSDPRIIALAERGVTCETVAAACDEAKAAKPNERISPGYVIAIADRWAKEADDIKGANGQAPSARASPQRKTAAQERAEVSAVLTGRGRANERDERDITGESVRIA